MANPMIGCRIPLEWHQQVQAICEATGSTPADINRDALGRYLGRSGAGARSLKRIERLEARVVALEQALVHAQHAAAFVQTLPGSR